MDEPIQVIRVMDDDSPKLKLYRRYGQWLVVLPGDIPEMLWFKNFSDALAKVQREIRGPYK